MIILPKEIKKGKRIGEGHRSVVRDFNILTNRYLSQNDERSRLEKD